MTTPRAAVLFDIDGTLIDSNYLHIQAWSEAMDRIDHPVDDARIHRAIGLDAGKLLAELLGEATDELGEKAKKQHIKRYAKLSDWLRPFAGARDLLRTVSEHQVSVVLATSAPEAELKLLRRALNAEKWITAVTSAEDVETAKPAPDVLVVALDRVGLTAADAVMVGDTVWDGQACTKAGVPFVGLRSGGIGAAELRDAGAIAVYADPQELLDALADSPLARLWAR